MRIAWFTHRYFPTLGGSENFSRAIVRRFVGAGHDVDVLTSDAHDLWYFIDRGRQRVSGPRESWVDGARVQRFAVRHVPLQRYIGRLLSYTPHWPTRCCWESFMPIIPGLTQVRGAYDAVFAVGFPFTIFSYAALRTARAAGAPLILNPFLHLATPGDPIHRSYSRPHQIRLLRAADAVIVQTDLEGHAVADWGVAPGRILKLGMAVEHAEVTGGDAAALRARLRIPAGRVVVGHLGTNDRNKGTTDLVLAAARLNEQRPADQPIHLILAGPSSPQFEAFAAQLPASAKRWLAVLGPLAPEHRPEFYAALDIFAMPSRADSFGIVFLEAWANAKPVVAAAAGGVTEVVNHERTGLLVPFGDVAEIARAIDRLATDRALAERLGTAGRAKIERGHSWDDKFAIVSARMHDLAGRQGLRTASISA
jgi:glycosyltransferase involved in cell wall biosynthesis